MVTFLFSFLVACSVSRPRTTFVTPTSEVEVVVTKTQSSLTITEMDKVISPSDFTYMGAFRLPEGKERPKTFAYGGNAMTFNPEGDASGSDDGFPGSLFITGHDRLAYGELPNGSQVAEITIPIPATAELSTDLPIASFLQEFQNVTQGFFPGKDEIPRIGLAYLDRSETGPQIHICWGQHMPPEIPSATHAVFNTDLSNANMRGIWYIGDLPSQSTNGYLFSIPDAWASKYTRNKPLATGRFRDGGWSGMGPNLFAYRPWVDKEGTYAAHSTRLEETVLLQYKSSLENDKIEGALRDYQHPDEWEGGAWLTTVNNACAVIFAGTKGSGDKYWYGYTNPTHPGEPCVDGDMVGEFTLCRYADGSPCPRDDLSECRHHNEYRGWWSSKFHAQILFYSPYELASVAAGEIASWAPQPYAVMNIDDVLFMNPDNVEPEMLGIGVQRRMRVGPLAYDRDNQILYLVEYFADGAKPVIHVWLLETQAYLSPVQ
jgi:hypothetical protein